MDYDKKCVLCNTKLMPEQKVVLSNKSCIFYQIPQDILIGSGIIIPKKHRKNVFELTDEEIKDKVTTPNRALTLRYARPSGNCCVTVFAFVVR